MSNLAAVRTQFPRVLEVVPEAARAPLGHALADTCLGGGIRLAALHEVYPAPPGGEAAATGFALALAARVTAQRRWLLWVRQDFSALENGEIHAAGLLEFGIDPGRVLMVRAADALDTLRAGAEGLACKGVGAVIIEAWGKTRTFDLAASRRLTLAAQQHGVTPIVLRFGAEPEPSAAETRWLVSAASSSGSENPDAPVFDAALVRNRHGACGRWIMEWDCNNGIFSPAHSCAMAAASSDRPSASAVEGLRQAG